MSTLLLDRDDVRKLLDMGEIIAAMEEVFRWQGQGLTTMPPKAYIEVEKGDFRAMPAALPDAAGVKWVNVHPDNRGRNLPTVMAVIVYNDPETGYPLSVMAASDITAFRTGATAAIAAKLLARKESRILAIGAGRQAYTQILAHSLIFKLEEIRVYDRFPEAFRRLAAQLPHLPLRESTLEETSGSDIVCMQTPAREPLVMKQWVKPGAHINAIGADAEGKEELDPAVLKTAKVVVDDIRQASAAGEINVPVSKGLFKPSDVYGNLGEIVSGKKPGRVNANEITMFDSTGVAIEDIASARLLLAKAKRAGVGRTVELV